MKSAPELDARWTRNFHAAQVRLALKERCVQALGGACQICGYNRCTAALEFHHTNPREKDFDISRALRRKMNWLQMETELSKCVLLCSCCHKETHAGLHPQYLEQDPAAGWD